MTTRTGLTALAGAPLMNVAPPVNSRANKPRFRSWHVEPNTFSMLFLNGHATNTYVEYWKSLDHTDIAVRCEASNPANHCVNGTATWFTRQDYKE